MPAPAGGSPESLFREALARNCPDPPAGLLALVSGGSDSVALALLAACYCRQQKLPLLLLHLNHKTRPDSDRDEAFVRSFAEGRNLPLACRCAPLPQEGNRLAAARTLRRAFAEQAAAPGWRILTGHQANDQREQVLMALVRERLPLGLAGMSERAGRWLKPLLDQERQALRDWLRARGESWVEDSSNQDRGRLRNRLRLGGLPDAPGVAPLLTGIAREAAPLAKGLRKEAGGLLRIQGLERRSWGLQFVRSGLERYYDPVIQLALEGLGRRLGAWTRSPSKSRLADLLDFCRRGSSGGWQDLGRGWQISLTRDRVCFHRWELPPAQARLKPGCRGRVGVTHYGWGQAPGRTCIRIPDPPRGEWLLRPARPGERLELPGRPRRRISDLLSEAALPLPLRAQPVLCHDGRVVALPALCDRQEQQKESSHERQCLWIDLPA